MVPAAALLDGQSRLSPIQRLNLALFIDAEHDRLLGRIQIKPHHVCHLFQKLWIARQLESLRAVRLESVGAPDIVDSSLTDTLTFRHGPATPVRHPCGLGLQGRIDDRCDLHKDYGEITSCLIRLKTFSLRTLRHLDGTQDGLSNEDLELIKKTEHRLEVLSHSPFISESVRKDLMSILKENAAESDDRDLYSSTDDHVRHIEAGLKAIQQEAKRAFGSSAA
jgi:hypothetical protein